MLRGLTSPFHDYLDALRRDMAGITAGEVADYIPELAKARPDSLAISFATVDGEVYSVGDSEAEFSIQSVSKPFVYGAALRRLGTEAVLQKVGVEPTGEAFNSIVLDQRNNRPFNPMVNAGAIAIAALTEGDTADERIANMRATFDAFAGRRLSLDDDVFASELETGHRNRAIAYLMLNTGMIDRQPEEVIGLYFRQCALRVTTEDLALMGATLANNGVQPKTGETVLEPENVRDVLTLMMSCGMYDYAGEWLYDVGLPAKSGVSGAIVAVLPGQLSIAIWSPPLDEIGNSVRGVAACRQISRDFGLHLFMNAASVENVVRRVVRADKQPSLRIRNPAERDILATEGRRIALVELQGALYFASAERMIRELRELDGDIDYLIFDFRRLNTIDAAAARFVDVYLARMRSAGVVIAFADTGRGAPGCPQRLAGLAERNGVETFADPDAALETYEEAVLSERLRHFDSSRFALEEIDLFQGLDRAALARIEQMIAPMQFETGERIFARGDPGHMFFVIARGSVSILVPTGDDGSVRIGCIGPGQFFGEMAILMGGARAADVVADERVVCYGLTAEQLADLGRDDPGTLSTMLSNMAREFSTRIQRANELISSQQ